MGSCATKLRAVDTAGVQLAACAQPLAKLATVDGDMLGADCQTCILQALGADAQLLASVSRSWQAAVEAVLPLRYERSLDDRGVGASLNGDSFLRYPEDVAVLPEGGMCVADSGRSRLQIFSHDAVPETSIGRKGAEKGRFHTPCGIACNGTALYVSDTWNRRVQKLRIADGAPLGTVGTKGDGEGEFSQPMGICVMADEVFVCDAHNHRIAVLGTDLSWRYAFGFAHARLYDEFGYGVAAALGGRRTGEFKRPSGVACDARELYVADSGNDRIQVFARDDEGRMRFERAFGSKGRRAGQFNRPCGIAATRGLLVVSEETRLQVLTLMGLPLQVITRASLGSVRPGKSLDSGGWRHIDSDMDVLRIGDGLAGLCADGERVWVADSLRSEIHVLLLRVTWSVTAMRQCTVSA